MTQDTKYRLSGYTVVTDVINEGEPNPRQIIYSTRSGRAAVVHSSLLNNIREGKFNEIPGRLLSSLFQMEMLVPSDEIEFERVMEQNRMNLEDTKVLSITMQPGANCQLGCHYCGQKHTKHYLSDNLYDKVINRVEHNLLHSGRKYNVLSVTWYGGEPLMAFKQIRDLSPRFISMANNSGRGYMSDMISNGLSLKENIFTELVTDCGVSQFQITLDGTEEHHDTRRITKSGEKTWQIILNNIVKCVHLPIYREKNVSISVRMNIDRTNYESISPFLNILHSHGLAGKIGLQFSPIVDWGDNHASDNSLSKDEFGEVEIDWYMQAIKLGFNPKLVPARTYGPCMVINQDSEVYDAFGNIFPCYEMPYTDEYQTSQYMIGNVQFPEATYNKKAITRNWFDDVVQGKSTCRDCTFFPVCGGGCPKSWLAGTPACPPFKFNMEDRLALQYILDNSNLTELT